jgi:hypothetical protein
MKKTDQQRFHYIESIVWWEGQINATHLMRHLQLSRDSTSSILKNYDQQYSDNLSYNSSLRARMVTGKFKASTDFGQFFDYLKLIKSSNHEAIFGSIEEVDAPLRNINAQLVRPILKAIREKLAIDTGYISLTSPDYLDRIIEPHTLIFDGLGWHVRAYCRKNGAYRDFVLSRFNGITEFEGEALSQIQQVDLWQTYTDVEIMPDPRLTAKQQAIIANDFKMANNKKVIKTRLALVNDLLLRLRLDHYKNTPEEQQIVLTTECRKRISAYLPNPT